MSPSQKAARNRREKLAEVRAAQRRKERRNTLIMIAVVGVVVAALVAGAAFALLRQDSGSDGGKIAGVQSFDDLGRNHVPGKVNYPQTPPVGGDHNQAWQNCGIYNAPVQNENAVHSLEHGAVWITYRQGLPADQVGKLQNLARGKPYVLLSPFPGLQTTAAASAWGKQVTVTDVSDPRLAGFVREYAQGKQTPEPGAPCTNGIGTPTG